ncbi:hypothetical protein N7508_000193 [Penicillium antarcticum]|uniref:uncharacterized protein n=1 Tax=Penicillium antarcticum TaxID=416450 RepID=UPI00238C3E53|nr:uncharacterized protein N7508_000193 [Penicillium antarcticum]KAJ5319910.1 hypothetical protein N7508_000193 [Penicillium antarcticum]
MTIRKEQAAYIAQHISDLQQQNPNADFKASEQWWTPSVDLGADLQESLGPVTNSQLEACIAKAFERKCSPEAMTEARGEAKTILAEYPDILERVNTMIFRNEQLWAQNERGRKFFTSPGILNENMPMLNESGYHVLAPSTVPVKGGKFRALDGHPGYTENIAQIENPEVIVEQYRHSVQLAKEADFDGIKLLSQG